MCGPAGPSVPRLSLKLRIRSCGAGSFFPSLLERRRRVDRVLYAVSMEAHLAVEDRAGAACAAPNRRPTVHRAVSFTRGGTPTLQPPAKGRVRGAPDVRDGPDGGL